MHIITVNMKVATEFYGISCPIFHINFLMNYHIVLLSPQMETRMHPKEKLRRITLSKMWMSMVG